MADKDIMVVFTDGTHFCAEGETMLDVRQGVLTVIDRRGSTLQCNWRHVALIKEEDRDGDE
jgi:ferredoxin-thioredoxin reductase catalytic subunit